MTASAPPHLPLLAAFVDELARSGMQHAVLCPGSRNAPVLLALDADPRITCWSAVDERSAAFLALGIAKATGRPAAVCVTSGTAISNLLPAATEAHEAGTPLLLLSADRPPELRDVGAGQTIDQLRALDAVTRWVVETDLSDATEARERWVRATACRAVAATLGPGRPGPVQVNLPLREPLTAPGPHAPLTTGRPGGRPWLTVTPAAGASSPAIASLAHRLLAAPHGVIVAGRAERTPELARFLPRLAAILGWPLLADPMSGARRGANAIAAYDLIIGADGVPSADPAGRRDGGRGSHPLDTVPSVVLRIGDLPVSKPLRAWLAGPAAEAEQIMLTPEAIWADEHGAASTWVTGDPLELVRALHAAVAGAAEHRSDDTDGTLLAAWQAADAAVTSGARARPTTEPGVDDALTEPLVARILATTLEPQDTLVVGASLPIRMLERWAPAVELPPRVLSNRGANGIDGVTSTAFGVLAARQTAEDAAPRVVAYLGDLTLLYDQGGLAHAASGLPLQVVVVNNDGGRIFERLAVARHAPADVLEPRILTPQRRDLSHLAAFYGLELVRPSTVGELQAVLALAPDRARLIEVRVPPAA
ncbi:MAG: 2-succinyl-5-enolpyruvyl-6-hydroxy-3-cyclohexene-1-carboxylic-acid synthase [Patulibacter minatonensis]